ncbi:cytoplasmic dynein 1 intermediate chain 1 [Boleophthalmus pectinirostris]|uniref:cytoplasmic dynein 1 intermediate chain 1 n=1 Tax=Boleophthalmus pectinirostris TaxID=150288 RepID=UPI00242AE48F|nr:cytoplasmic dynein 1 intermediate chain 1 [Boleophthalmus pectinirostris]
MSDKSDLKAELERKKQRLAQIREEKKRKEEERKKKESRKAEIQQKTEIATEDSDLDRKRRETEALLQSIGISPEPSLVPAPMSPSKSLSTPSETGSQDSAEGGAAGRFTRLQAAAPSSRTLQWDTDPSVLQLHADSELGRRLQRLGASRITQVDFQPKELVSYSKETQTPSTTQPHEVEEEEEDEEMEVKPGLMEAELQDDDEAKETKDGVVPLLRELTEEERQQILHSADFQSFFDCSIRVMERALAEDSHIYYDYSGRDHHKDGDVSGGSSLSFSRVFYDEHWSKHRVITCLDWSPQYPELLSPPTTITTMLS